MGQLIFDLLIEIAGTRRGARILGFVLLAAAALVCVLVVAPALRG